MTFSLALLGTDTNYQTALNPSEYPLGETLSVISSLLAHHQPLPPLISDGVEDLCHQNFHLINGPTTFGKEVYDRIKRGFFASLRALASGHTQINIFAHSRGGAEAILLAHELNRLQMLGEELNLENINHSSIPKLKDELQKLSWTEVDLLAMKQNLSQLKLSMFVLDPVPGDGYLGLGWYEEGFKDLPPIVKHFEEYVYEHEQTRFFYPIIPKPHDEFGSHYQVQILPGHHGSGSGNPYDQSKLWKTAAPSQFNIAHTQELQKLVLVKLAYFLIQHGVSFRLSSSFGGNLAQQQIPVLHTWVGLLQAMQIFPKEILAQELINIYRFFVEEQAIETFKLFQKTAYPVLGCLPGNSRFIYHHGIGGYLNQQPRQIFNDSSHFFNSEHMQHFIHSVLSVTGDEDPLVYLDKLIGFFQDKIAEDPSLQTLSGSQEPMIQALSDAIRGPYINDYYNTPEKMAQLVTKVGHLINVFVQEEPVDNTRAHFFQGLKQELLATLDQRMQNLSRSLGMQMENTWELNLLQVFHQDLEQVMQDIDWPEDIAAELRGIILENMTQLSEDMLQNAGNFAAIPDMIRAYREKMNGACGDICRPLVDKLQTFEVQIKHLSAQDEKMKHHQANIQGMAGILQQMFEVTEIAGQFEEILLSARDKQELAKQFSTHLNHFLSYIETHHLNSSMVLNTLQSYPVLCDGLMQNPRFIKLCEQHFRQDWLALKHAPLAACEELNRKYAVLWSYPLSPGLQRLKLDFEKGVFSLKVQSIVEQASDLGHGLEGLCQVQNILQHLEELKLGISKPEKLSVQRQGSYLIPSSVDLHHQAKYQMVEQAIRQLKLQFPELGQDLSRWVQVFQAEIKAYQLQTNTPSKQDILTQLQVSLSSQELDIAKLVHFFENIHQNEFNLRLHGDPLWKQNLKNFVVILPSLIMVTSVVVASIFAGPLLVSLISALSLLCLALEAAVIHQARGHFSFWRPKGDDFAQRIDHLENKLRSSLS